MIEIIFFASILLYLIIRRALFWRKVIYPAKVKTAMYPFFDVRDRLLRLVAEGRISDESLIFQTFYSNTNHVLAHFEDSKKFSLRKLLEYQKEADTEKVAEYIRKIVKELKAINDDYLKDTIRIYFQSLLILIVKNSALFIATIVSVEVIKMIGEKCRNVIAKYSKRYASVIKMYYKTSRIQEILLGT